MNHFLRLIFCLGLSLGVLQAQDNATITGTVIDQDQAPVIGANVVLQGTNYGTTTNAAGRFMLTNVPAGSYELRVSFIGFQAFSQNIQVNAGQSLDVAVSLTEEPLTLEGLIVTAQRREQVIQEVPVAVTSWEGDFLKTRGVFELDALSDYVPGLQVQIQSVNNPGFVIRGITSDDGDSRIEPRVSVFQDGVSISKSRGSVVEIFDMERVEVLKGPQGTLFGRGAQIGAIHLIQNKAKNELSGELTLGAGNEGQYLANGYVNFPIAEGKLFGRVAAIYNKRDGFIENLSGGDLNGKETVAFRSSLRWLASEKTVFDLIVNFQKDTPPGTSFKSGAYAPLNGSTSPFTFADMERGEDLFIDRIVWGTTLIANHTFNSKWDLTSITAYREFDSYESFDSDGTVAPALWFAEDAEGIQLSQELRFTFTDERRFSGFFGGSFFYEDGSQAVPFETDERSYFALFSPLLGGLGVPFVPLVVNGVANLSVTNNPLTGQPFKTFHSEAQANFGTNYAIELFADGTFNILDNLKVTAGIRGTYENITGALEVTNSETPGSLGIILGVAPNNLFAPTNGRREANEAFFSAVGRLAVNYDVNENINLFGSVARGRRPNVVQVNATTVDVLSDETVWSYELGTKSLFLNNRLQFDLSGFYYDYSNFQTSVAVLGPDGLEIETRDAGNATAFGLETAFRYLANKYLSVFANYGYIDATFDDTDSDGNAQGLAGNRFRLTPEHSISAGIEVNVPFGGERFAFFFKPTYTYRSQVFFQEENEPGIEQAGYGLLNLFAGFDLFDRATTITFYMNNALDEDYIIDAGNTGGAFGIPTFIAGLPRLWGFRLTGRF